MSALCSVLYFKLLGAVFLNYRAQGTGTCMAACSCLSLLDPTCLKLLSTAHVKDRRTATFSFISKGLIQVPLGEDAVTSNTKTCIL